MKEHYQKIIKVSELYCYPVKSCRGISLKTAEIGSMGILYDRQWMFVNENGVFCAQRGDTKTGAMGIPSLCRIVTNTDNGNLILSAPDMADLILPLHGNDGFKINVRVWDSFTVGIDQGDEAATWATEYFNREVPGKYRLVRMANDQIRKTELGSSALAFADAYPFLLLSRASFDHLNGKMQEPLTIDRFRPNIVITGCCPNDEDTIPGFNIGKIKFIGIKLCIRCSITTINQATGVRGKEPLNTLSEYRKTEKGVIFGRYFNHHNSGVISIGDPLVFSE